MNTLSRAIFIAALQWILCYESFIYRESDKKTSHWQVDQPSMQNSWQTCITFIHCPSSIAVDDNRAVSHSRFVNRRIAKSQILHFLAWTRNLFLRRPTWSYIVQPGKIKSSQLRQCPKTSLIIFGHPSVFPIMIVTTWQSSQSLFQSISRVLCGSRISISFEHLPRLTT